jgi:hypothetical protein
LPEDTLLDLFSDFSRRFSQLSPLVTVSIEPRHIFHITS